MASKHGGMALKGSSAGTWWFCLDRDIHTDLHMKKLNQLNEEVFLFLFFSPGGEIT